MIFYSDKQRQKIFFIKEHHLQLLKSKHIPLKQIEYLPFFKVSKEDVLDFLNLQLSIEKSLFGETFTSLDLSGGGKFLPSDSKLDLELIKHDIENSISNAESYGEIEFSCYMNVEGVTLVYIGETGNVIPTGFTGLSNNLPRTIYTAISNVLGFHALYYRDPKPADAKDGIDLSELLRIICK